MKEDSWLPLALALVPYAIYMSIYNSDMTSSSWWQQAEAFNEHLEGLAPYYISILDLCGSLAVCRYYRNDLLKSEKSWFEVLVVCTMMQFGGTTIIGVLLGQTPSWILSKTAFPALFLAYWLTFCCPSDIFWKQLANNTLFINVASIGGAISAGHAVTSWGADKALENLFHNSPERYSNSFLTVVACGTLAACGGGLLADITGVNRPVSSSLGIFKSGNYKTTATLNRSFWLALLYYFLRKEALFGLRTKESAHLAIAGLQLLHHYSTSLFKVDVYQFLSNALLALLFIPPKFDRDS